MTEAAAPLWHSLGESDVPLGREWLSPWEVDRLMSMRFTKRRREWLLGRWTGKQAVAHHLGLRWQAADPARVEIRTVSAGVTQGAPEVFVGDVRAPLEVSLTHRAGWAVCAVSGGAAIGCDIELIEPRSPAFVRDYLTLNEQNAVRSPPFEVSADVLANLIWSAKESAMKVLKTGTRRAAGSLEVGLGGDAPRMDWRPLVVRAEEGAVFPGWWRQYGEFLLTVVATRACPPPRSCVEPPALASARPSHSWLARPRDI